MVPHCQTRLAKVKSLPQEMKFPLRSMLIHRLSEYLSSSAPVYVEAWWHKARTTQQAKTSLPLDISIYFFFIFIFKTYNSKDQSIRSITGICIIYLFIMTSTAKRPRPISVCVWVNKG
ncbi:uncharacterized protein ACNLHF_003883 isoform 1-T1 [Anomaloglossus baeobatrachus]